MVSAMGVGHEGFAAVRRPFDRSAELLRGPGDDGLFGIVINLGAEPAADVGGDDPNLVLRHLQDIGAHQQPDDMRILAGGVERVFAVRAVIIADRRARLQRVRDQPVVGDVDLRNILGLGEGLVAGCPVAQFPVVAEVALGIAPNLRCGGGHGLPGRGASRQGLIVDDDLFGRVARLVAGFRDHHGDLIADMTDGIGHQNGMRRFDHRIAVAVRDLPAAGQSAETGRRDVRASEDRNHASCRSGGLGVDALDIGMGMG